MSETASIKFTLNELEEVRVALEVQVRMRREDIESRDDAWNFDSLAGALRKVTARLAVIEAAR